MGLDFAELVMNVEDEFGIVLSEEAYPIRTVGELTDYIMKRIQYAAKIPCPSQAAFLLVRAELMKTLNIPRREIRPSTPLAPLLARGDLRKT